MHRRRRLLTAFVAACVALMPLPISTSSAAQTPESWARLGPMGPGAIDAIAVAPESPEGQLLFATRNNQVLRSSNGGRTWERVTTPFSAGAADLHFFGFAPPPEGFIAPLYALVQNASSDSGWSLFRSRDAGATWVTAVSGPRVASPPRLTMSPNFSVDSTMFLIVNGQLRRSRDRGDNWSNISLPEDQRAQQLVFSPGVASDQTLFVAVATRDSPPSDLVADQTLTDHSDSAGVLMSADGGDTWTMAAAGLEIDGTPYRNVHGLAISPNYGEDGTLLAYAWGPITPFAQPTALARYDWTSRLFSSRDGGATWEPSSMPTGSRQTSVTLALAPSFGADGAAFAALNHSGATPAAFGCAVLRTTDAGATWTVAVRAVQSYVCSRAQALGAESDFSMLVLRGGEWAATSGGLAERLLRRLQDGPSELSPVSNPVATILSPLRGPDPIVFIGAWGSGVWAFGRDVQPTDGRLPCAVDTGPAFTRVWTADPLMHGWLGCAVAAQQQVRVREIRVRPPQGRSLRSYWTEDGDTEWFELFETYWLPRAKATRLWPDLPYQTVDGIVQRFEGGRLIWLPRSDGTGTILQLVSGRDTGSWREMPAIPIALPAPLSSTTPSTARSPKTFEPAPGAPRGRASRVSLAFAHMRRRRALGPRPPGLTRKSRTR